MEVKKTPDYFGEILRFLLVGGILCFLLFGCCPKIVEKVVNETKIEYRERTVHDTTTFEIEKEVEKIVTRDTVSHLENRWAKSDAIVFDGFLSHSLESIPQEVKVPVEVKVRDTLWREREAKETIKEVKVEKPLSWWKSCKLDLFPWVFAGLVLCLLWIFKKPILSILKIS